MVRAKLWVYQPNDKCKIYIYKNIFDKLYKNSFVHVTSCPNSSSYGLAIKYTLINPTLYTFESYISQSLPSTKPLDFQLLPREGTPKPHIFDYAIDSEGYTLSYDGLWRKKIKVTKYSWKILKKTTPTPPIHGWICTKIEHLQGKYITSSNNPPKPILPTRPPIKEDLKDPRFWLYLGILVGALLFLGLL